MSKPVRIVVHCTDEPNTAKRDKEYYRHFFFEVRGWSHYGYHIIVYQNGLWENLQPLPDPKRNGGEITDATMANGAKGYNRDSLHIAYVGGRWGNSQRRGDTRTDEQVLTMRDLIRQLKADFGITEVVGHRDLPGVTKTCPNFDAKSEYRDV